MRGAMPSSTRLTTAAAAVQGCLRGKQVAVKFFLPQSEENGMGRQMAAVRAHAAGSDPVKGATDQFSADDVADAVRREGNHERKME